HQLEGFPSCFASERHLINWLAKVAYRKALDELRRKKAEPLAERDVAGSVNGTPSVVWECLQQLPAGDSQILLWYFYDGLTDIQIGLRLYGEEVSVEARGQRARKGRLAALRQLRVILLRRGVDPDEWDLPPRACPQSGTPTADKRGKCRA